MEKIAELLRSARTHHQDGRVEEAVISLRQAAVLEPDCAPLQASLAQALNEATDYPSALAASQSAIAISPKLVLAHTCLAVALAGLHRLPEAATAFQQSLRLDPDQPEVLSRFAIVLTTLQHVDAALVCHRRAIELSPDNPQLHLALARTLMHHLDTPNAVTAASQAVALAPDMVEALVVLGTCLSTLGRFAEAADCLRRALSLDPDNAEAYRCLAAIGQPDPNGSDMQLLSALLDRDDLPVADRISAGFALGERLDQAGRYDEAFPRIAEANRLLRQVRTAAGRRFDLADLRRSVDEAIAHGSADFFARTRGWGNPSELPVFVVGMPRSGTTLVERIMASHGQVAGVGERPDLNRIARMMMLENPGRPVEAWDATIARRHADAYIAKLATMAPGAIRVVDKMPENLFVLGIAAALFPRARVVLCRRDLRDVSLSCYFQHFAIGHDFSTDLADCGRRALEADRLLVHWRQALPCQKIETHYETLVEDFEPQVRRLIEFLDLPWDPACLAFHRTDGPVLTASFWQVRQPLFASSIGRWRHYRDHLAPLMAVLGPDPAGAA